MTFKKMMKKTTIKTLIIVMLSLIMVFGVSFALLNEKPVLAETITLESTEVKDRYVLNSEATFSETVKVSYNDKEYDATNGVVKYPDGRVMKVGKLKFDTSGIYTISYYFEDNGVLNTATKKFEVFSSLYGFTDNNGSTITAAPARPINDRELLPEVPDPQYLVSGKEGMILNFRQGANFVYNKPIDLSDPDYADGLTSIIELDPRLGSYDSSTGIYTATAYECTVRLVDCYDSSIYVDINPKRNMSNGQLYMNVQSSQTAWHVLCSNRPNREEKYNLVNIDGEEWHSSFDISFHCTGNFEFTKNGWYKWTKSGIEFKYNYEKDRIYYTNETNGRYNHLLEDFQNKDIWGDKTFSGFTTGEVYLQILVDSYYAEEARVEVISIGKDDASVFNNQEILEKGYVDERAPIIEIEDKGYGDSAFVALGDTFTVPSAKAFDVNLKGDVEVKVFKGYGNSNQSRVSLVDNKFKVSENLRYTIEYSATDKSGNLSSKTFSVVPIVSDSDKTIVLHTANVDKLTVGAINTLPEYVLTSLNTSETYLNITAKHDKETIKINPETRMFKPKYSGEYTIVYEYGDALFNYVYEYKIDAEVDATFYSFIENAVIPKYLVKNSVYSFNSINAYNYANGYPEAVDAKAYISFDGGEEIEIKDLHSVEIKGSSTAQVIFRANDAVAMSNVAKIVDTGYGSEDGKILMKEYFDYQGKWNVYDVNTETGKALKDITYESIANSGNNNLTFISPLPYKEFTLIYKLPKEEGLKIKGYKISLTNIYDAEDKFEFTILNEKGKMYLYMNNERYDLSSFNVAFDGIQKRLSYSYNERLLRIGGTDKFGLDINLGSELAYLDIELIEMEGNAKIVVSQVGNQNLVGNKFNDNQFPIVSVRDPQGHYAIGDIVNVYAPTVADVLTGIDVKKSSFSVVSKSGKVVKDVNGVELTTCDLFSNYQIELFEYDTYFVKYNIYDLEGSNVSFTYEITVIETNKPVIEFKEGYDENTLLKYKVGQKIKIEYIVTDESEFSAYGNLYRVYDASYKNCVDDTEDGTFTILTKGEYYFEVIARDVYGNFAIRRLKLEII